MLKCESETVVVMNLADADLGYFTVSTTMKSDFKRICEMVGGEDRLISLRRCTQGIRTTEWICQIPISFYQLPIQKSKKPRKLTDKQLIALKQNQYAKKELAA